MHAVDDHVRAPDSPAAQEVVRVAQQGVVSVSKAVGYLDLRQTSQFFALVAQDMARAAEHYRRTLR